MSNSVEELMLTASELFHYAHKFRNALFLIVVNRNESLHEVIMDLRVLLSSRVPCALVYGSGLDVHGIVERWNTHGFSFRRLSFQAPGDVSRSQISELIGNGEIPLLESQAAPQRFDELCVEMASELGAQKLVFFTKDKGLILDGVYRSYPSIEEVQSCLSAGASCNVDTELLAKLLQAQVVYGFDTVFLEAKSGSLFRELFTYRGSGTLITDSYPNVLRPAVASDVADILFLLKPAMTNSSVLPMSEEQLIDAIDQFYVFTVDGKIVACARLKDFGSYAELGKICTLPRYQGKGRARQLTQKLLNEAQQKGKTGVFALSVEPLMWTFFTDLGFKECDRSELPQVWKAQYDEARKSKAFLLGF